MEQKHGLHTQVEHLVFALLTISLRGMGGPQLKSHDKSWSGSLVEFLIG